MMKVRNERKNNEANYRPVVIYNKFPETQHKHIAHSFCFISIAGNMIEIFLFFDSRWNDEILTDSIDSHYVHFLSVEEFVKDIDIATSFTIIN